MSRASKAEVSWTHPETEEDLLVVGACYPGAPERGPSYSCAGEPAEPPSVEDLEVYEDAGRGKRGARRPDVEAWLGSTAGLSALTELEAELLEDAGDREEAAREDYEESQADARRESRWGW